MTKAIFAMLASMAVLGSSTGRAELKSAGLFVEPALTYELGKTSTDYPGPISNSSGDANGLGVGARLGFHVSEAIFLGVDGRYAKTDFKESSVNYSSKADETSWGPVLGLQMPRIGLRVWGEYVAGGTLDPASNNGLDLQYTDATGYRVGTGFRLSAVSLNLEYQNLKYGTTTLQQAGPFTPGSLGSVQPTSETWVASLSFPLEL